MKAGRNLEYWTLKVDGEKGAHQQNNKQWAAKWESQNLVSQKAKEDRISSYIK